MQNQISCKREKKKNTENKFGTKILFARHANSHFKILRLFARRFFLAIRTFKKKSYSQGRAIRLYVWCHFVEGLNPKTQFPQNLCNDEET